MANDAPTTDSDPATTPRAVPVPAGSGAPVAPVASALPSTGARLLAFAAIVVSGICGGLIGWRVAELSISGDPGIVPGLAGLAGAVVAAGGVAVVSVLVLRAMGEWQKILETGDPAAARRNRRPS